MSSVTAEWLNGLVTAAESVDLLRLSRRMLGDALVYERPGSTVEAPPVLALRLETERTFNIYTRVVATLTHTTTLATIKHVFPFDPLLSYDRIDTKYTRAAAIDANNVRGPGCAVFYAGEPPPIQVAMFFDEIYAWARLFNALPQGGRR